MSELCTWTKSQIQGLQDGKLIEYIHVLCMLVCVCGVWFLPIQFCSIHLKGHSTQLPLAPMVFCAEGARITPKRSERQGSVPSLDGSLPFCEAAVRGACLLQLDPAHPSNNKREI